MAADEPSMAGSIPATLNNENGVALGSGERDVIGSRGKQVDRRNGEGAIPADDEPDLAEGSRTLN